MALFWSEGAGLVESAQPVQLPIGQQLGHSGMSQASAGRLAVEPRVTPIGGLPAGLGLLGMGATLPLQGQGLEAVQPGDAIPALLAPILAALKGLAPSILAGLGGMAVGGLLGGGQEGEGGLGIGETPTSETIRWPWQTPTGEGFIAPWTEQVSLPGGLYGQAGKGYPEMGIVKTWTNAARDGSTPATVEFALLTNGRVMSRSVLGVIKSWKPKKMIVLSTNPRLSMIKKFDRANKRINKVIKRFGGGRKTVAIGAPTKYLSAAEKKLIRAGG